MTIGLRPIAVAAAMAALAGCGAQPPDVADRPIIPVADSAAARPVQFHRIVIDIDRGTDVGWLSRGIGFCTEMQRWVYRPGQLSLFGKEVTETFRAELMAANYNVVGDPDALFQDSTAWQAEYLIAGAVKNLNAGLCYAFNRWTNQTMIHGFAVMEVNWQIYSRLDRKVVYQTMTQGRGDIRAPSVTGDPDVFLDAFAQATRNLLGDRGFHDLIAGEAPPQAPRPAVTLREAVVPNGALFGDAIQRNMATVRANVVTVRSVEGHGSGFFIDGAGHVLTNEHVVGGAARVNVILESGQELEGTVIATDPRRDVALVKAAPGGQRGLPVRETRPAIGDEVYAVGSPMLEALSGTVSKGIVSALRNFDGLDYIQSDVVTAGGSSGGPLLDDRGNVVGVTVSGFTEGEAPTGLNLFIPIADALRALGVGRVVSAN
jgi:S1-C subfamily serine protease